jgi:hypothetical protein
MTSKGDPERLLQRGIERAARALYDVVTTTVYPTIPGTSAVDKALTSAARSGRRRSIGHEHEGNSQACDECRGAFACCFGMP